MKTRIKVASAALLACASFVLSGCGGGAGNKYMGIHSDHNINSIHELFVRAECRRLASLSEYTDTLDTETYGDCMKAAGFACKRDFETECYFDSLNNLECYGEHTDGFRCDRRAAIPEEFRECFIREVKDIAFDWDGYIEQAWPCNSLKK